MWIEFGHFLLILSFSLSLVLAIVPFIGVYFRKQQLVILSFPLIILIFLSLLSSLAIFHYSYLVSDFSLKNIFENSSVLQPTIYKIVGVWSNHEGSMFLWVFILALFSFLAALFSRSSSLVFRAMFLGCQACLLSGFLAFLIFTSNPFIRLEPVPLEGLGINPLLQDIGLLLHPPILYLGYVGFSVCFSFAIVALLRKEIEPSWAIRMRPWVLISWMFLTAGIALGSYWAYYELGWGGFWYWDPVENASLMPWLSGTALLHSVLVMVKRNALKIWTIFLALVTFSFSLLGTFLVRSGILISVHNFTVEPTKGLFILMLFAVYIGGAFILFAIRSYGLNKGALFSIVSKEASLILNNIFLLFMLFAVFIGTFYPLFIQITVGEEIFVGPPFFNTVISIFLAPILILLPISVYLPWKNAKLKEAIKSLSAVIIMVALIVIWVKFNYEMQLIHIIFFIALACWVILGSISYFISRSAILKAGYPAFLYRLKGLPISIYGFTLVHMGLGISLLGIIISGAFEKTASYSMTVGDKINFVGKEISFSNLHKQKFSNYSAEEVTLLLKDKVNSSKEAVVTIERRYFRLQKLYLLKTAQYRNNISHYYFIMDGGDKDKIRIVISYKPLVLAIWIGAIFMVLGSLLCLLDKRWLVSRSKNEKY